MPFKAKEAHRHKFPKAKCRVTNWREYNEYLRLRGDVRIWFDPGLLFDWRAKGPRNPGGKRLYSDLAVELCLTLRCVFRLPLRQTQGMVRSLFGLMDLPLPVPSFSTLSRRGRSLIIQDAAFKSEAPITLIVDSTGLSVHSGRDWVQEKHGPIKTRRTWRKLHIGLDPDSGEIITSLLTTNSIHDELALPDLCATDHSVGKFLADGADCSWIA